MSVKSIFDLKTSNTELSSSNQGLTNYRYQELQPLKNSTLNDFAGGEQTYRWTYGSNTWFIPNKSYMRIRAKLTITDPQNKKGIVPNMNMANCLFSSAQFKVADQMVSQLTDNYTQVSTLKSRMMNSGDWLNTYGTDTNMWNVHPEVRMSMLRKHNIGNNVNDLHTNGFGDYYHMDWTQFYSQIDKTSLPNDLLEISHNNADKTITFKYKDHNSIGSRVQFSNHIDTLFKKGDLFTITVPKVSNSGEKITLSLKLISIKSATEASVNGNTDNQLIFSVLDPVDLKDFTIDKTGQYLNSSAIRVLDIIRYRKSYYNDIQSFELFWKPPLSIFDIKHAMPCAGTKYQLDLTPYPNDSWEKRAVKSLYGKAIHNTDYTIEIEDIKFYLLICQSNPIKDNFTFFLDLNEVSAQQVQITSSNEQKSLDIKESSYAVAIAFQDESAGNNTMYSPSFFKVRNNIELKLNRFYIRYAGQQKPMPDQEGYIGSRIDSFKNAYVRCLQYTGASRGDSVETYDEWKKRGAYFYYSFPKTASDRSTRCYIQTSFKDNVIETARPKILVFDFYKKVVICEVNNGKISRISPVDA